MSGATMQQAFSATRASVMTVHLCSTVPMGELEGRTGADSFGLVHGCSNIYVNLIRRPVGEWVCLDARTALGGNGCGMAESTLYDEAGLLGRATQSLVVRAR